MSKDNDQPATLSVESQQKNGLPKQLAGKYMTFKLASEEYGLAILRVREIIGLMEITRVPKTKDFIRGVINLRGKVIPVVDLRLIFGMNRTENTDQTVIIVVQWTCGSTATTMGILVDEVLEVMSIEPEQIEPPPDLRSINGDNDFILGIGKADKRVICLLDIERVLSKDEAIRLATLGTPSETTRAQ
jgi:purine-binding chemotaxis protein CheW